jgi:hypothetical protein
MGPGRSAATHGHPGGRGGPVRQDGRPSRIAAVRSQAWSASVAGRPEGGSHARPARRPSRSAERGRVGQGRSTTPRSAGWAAEPNCRTAVAAGVQGQTKAGRVRGRLGGGRAVDARDMLGGGLAVDAHGWARRRAADVAAVTWRGRGGGEMR